MGGCRVRWGTKGASTDAFKEMELTSSRRKALNFSLRPSWLLDMLPGDFKQKGGGRFLLRREEGGKSKKEKTEEVGGGGGKAGRVKNTNTSTKYKYIKHHLLNLNKTHRRQKTSIRQ